LIHGGWENNMFPRFRILARVKIKKLFFLTVLKKGDGDKNFRSSEVISGIATCEAVNIRVVWGLLMNI
jgi:hypothetical protein